MVGREAVAPEDLAEEDLPRGSERILLVDDERDLVEIGRMMLQRLGYRVTSAGSGVEGLRMFMDHPDELDLILTDHTMPKMTGAEMAREILSARPDMPIILCTGYTERITAEEILAMGVSRFLMKPLAFREVALAIREVLDQAASARNDDRSPSAPGAAPPVSHGVG